MSFTSSLKGISQSFKTYFDESKQASMAVILKLRDFRNNPDFFQKVGQVACASLQLIIIHVPSAASLSRFSFVLATVNMHDFYRFLKLPRQWLFPVSTETINECAVLESLKRVLDNQLVIAHPDSKEIKGDIAYLCLKGQLQEMAEHQDAYRNANEFKKVLLRRLKSDEFKKVLKEKEINYNLDFSKVSLDQLQVVLRRSPLLERIGNVIWTIVDVGCIGLYLQGWKVLDTAKWAAQIGQYRLFNWVKHCQLGHIVTGLVWTGFTLKLIEAIRKLTDEKLALTSQQKRQAIWDVITSTAESILFGATYLSQTGRLRINATYLLCGAIIAKSLGLLAIATQPKREFFQRPQTVSAV